MAHTHDWHDDFLGSVQESPGDRTLHSKPVILPSKIIVVLSEICIITLAIKTPEMPASLTWMETGIMLVTFAGPFASLFLRDIIHKGALSEIYPHLIESLLFGSLNYFKVIIEDVDSIKIMMHFLCHKQVIAIIADYCTRGKEEDR